MTTKIQKVFRIVPYSILGIAIFSVLPFPKNDNAIIALINITAFWWLVQFLILYNFWISRKYFFDKSQKMMMVWVQLYLLWNVFNIVRGLLVAETYWDWKALIGNGMALMIPMVAYSTTNVVFFQSFLKGCVKYGLPSFGIFLFLITNDAFGYYLVPFSFLALFVPIIKRPWNWIILAVSVFVMVADVTARSNVLKFGVPITLSFIYYFRFILSTKILELIRKLLFVTPLLFFFLAVTGVFNVFNMDEYVKGDAVETRIDTKGEIIEEDLKGDSRTFLYLEVLNTALKLDTWWIGRSPARGNISESFGEGDMNKRGERLMNEVCILNVFTWTGIVGVLLYMMAFYKASYIAINQSNNIFSKILGLFVAFRWLFAWVEDINNFTLTTFFLWFMIGLCFSKTFRKMNDQEVRIWVRGIFEKENPLSRRMRHILEFTNNNKNNNI